MRTTQFRNASVLDGSGAVPFRGDVLVDGATLMPGLIEPHARLSLVDQATPEAFNTIPVEEHLLLTLKHAKLYLDCGYTACFSAAATKPRLDVVARNAIERGDHPGPQMRAASVQFTVTGGGGALRQMHLDPGEAMFTLPCDGPVEFRRVASEARRPGAVCSPST